MPKKPIDDNHPPWLRDALSEWKREVAAENARLQTPMYRCRVEARWLGDDVECTVIAHAVSLRDVVTGHSIPTEEGLPGGRGVHSVATP